MDQSVALFAAYLDPDSKARTAKKICLKYSETVEYEQDI